MLLMTKLLNIDIFLPILTSILQHQTLFFVIHCSEVLLTCTVVILMIEQMLEIMDANFVRKVNYSLPVFRCGAASLKVRIKNLNVAQIVLMQ